MVEGEGYGSATCQYLNRVQLADKWCRSAWPEVGSPGRQGYSQLPWIPVGTPNRNPRNAKQESKEHQTFTGFWLDTFSLGVAD